MISVVIPALNAERTLPSTLTALVPAAVDGVVREVIVADGGSTDHTRQIADHAGGDQRLAHRIGMQVRQAHLRAAWRIARRTGGGELWASRQRELHKQVAQRARFRRFCLCL